MLLGLLASPKATAQAADPEGPPAEHVEVRVTAEGPSGPVPIGTPFEVRYHLEYPVGTRVFFPETPEVAPLVLVETRHQVSPVLGVSSSEDHVLRLMPVRRGSARVPSFEVP